MTQPNLDTHSPCGKVFNVSVEIEFDGWPTGETVQLTLICDPLAIWCGSRSLEANPDCINGWVPEDGRSERHGEVTKRCAGLL